MLLHASSYELLAIFAAARNYAFVHDVNHAISINNILEIYSALYRLIEPGVEWTDVVLTRVNNIESQLEETINPILIGGYKLEIRSIYENNPASPESVTSRLTANHAAMRNVAGENAITIERDAIDPLTFPECDGVSADEKRRAMFQGLNPPAIADHYIRQIISSEEQQHFREALPGLR